MKESDLIKLEDVDGRRRVVTCPNGKDIWQSEYLPDFGASDGYKKGATIGAAWDYTVDELLNNLPREPRYRFRRTSAYLEKAGTIGAAQNPPLDAHAVLSGLKNRQRFYF